MDILDAEERQATLSEARDSLLGRYLAEATQAKRTDTGCWLFPRYRGTGDYGLVIWDGRHHAAHRVAYTLFIAPLHDSDVVHHTCHNRRCANPAHLQLVTQRENLAEMLERQSLRRRIAELETALAEVAPNHRLLNQAA